MPFYDSISEFIKSILKRRRKMNAALDNNSNPGYISGVFSVSTPTVKLTGRGTQLDPLKAEVIGGVSGGGPVTWESVTGKPTTVDGFGITDAVETSGSYANPSWLTELHWSKISNRPNTVSGYGITDGVTLNGTENLANKTLVNPKFNITNQAQGDILYFNGTDWVRLPRGSNGQALKVQSNTLVWDTDQVASGPGGGSIVSVFGRTDPSITAQTGDYTFAQIGSKPTTISGYGITDGVTLTGAQVLTQKTLTSPIINLGSDASGDTYFRNASGQLTRVAAGSLGQVYTMGASSVPQWASPQTFNKATVAELRANNSPSITLPYWISDEGKEGFFYYDSTDTTSADNLGTILVSADGKRFKRAYEGTIYTTWFGLKVGDNNNSVQTANVTAIVNASAAAKSRQWVVTPGGGTLYLNSTITLTNTLSKRLYTRFDCEISYTGAGDCFILQGGHGMQFEIKGRLYGPNAVGNNSSEASWSSMTGRGIYMKNLYNSTVRVFEVSLFNTGLEMAGEANGDVNSANGSQYNHVYFDRIFHNYKQIQITTYGVAGTHGNWCNESFWWGGQIGNGIPGVSYGNGGWYGLVVDKGVGASGVTNPQPFYGINGHNFYNVGFEGNDTYIKAGYTGNFLFIGCSFEPEGAHTHFDLDPVNCQLWRFEGSTAMRDSKFAAGRRGYKTHITNAGFYGAIASDTDSQFIGHSVTSIPASPVMTGFTYSPNGNFIVSQDTYAGPSALENNDDNTHVMWSKLAQFPNVQNGTIRFDGYRRHGAYKRSFLESTSNTTPVACPPVLGYVRVQSSVTVNPKVFQIYYKDCVNTGASTVSNFEHFYVEKNNDTAIEFVKSDDNSPLITSDKFPTQGLYYCVWRNSAFKVYRIDTPTTGIGTGDVLGPSSSVDNEIALYSLTTGKVIKRSTGTGYVKVTSGVYQTPSATIPYTDLSSTGSAALQSIRRNAANNGWEWYTPGSGGGGGVDTVNPISGLGDAQGASIVGNLLTLHGATSTTGGVITTASQTLPGDKTFAGTVTFKQGTSGGNGQVRFNSNSILRDLVDIPAHMEYDNLTGDWWGTNNALERTKFIRTDTVGTVTQLTWEANPIGEGYGGNGADTAVTISTSSSSVADGVGVIMCTYTGAGSQVINLPNASLYPNRRITILSRAVGKTVSMSNGDPHANAVNVTGTSPSGITYRSISGNWIIINKF
jgi:hypothetical protein